MSKEAKPVINNKKRKSDSEGDAINDKKKKQKEQADVLIIFHQDHYEKPCIYDIPAYLVGDDIEFLRELQGEFNEINDNDGKDEWEHSGKLMDKLGIGYKEGKGWEDEGYEDEGEDSVHDPPIWRNCLVEKWPRKFQGEREIFYFTSE